MKVYVITSGDYDEYNIVAVFIERKNAERCLRKLHGETMGARIEEYEAKDDEVEKIVNILRKKVYRVRMNCDGNDARAYLKKNIGILGGWKSEDDFCYKKALKAEVLQNKNELYGWFFAVDEKHAIKILNAKRIQLLSRGGFK